MPREPLSISIVVPVHDGAATLPACLAAARACVPPAVEIIVVDDGSGGDSAAVAVAAGAQVLSLPERGGPARARNRGAEEASGDLLFFVDADVVVPADATAQVLDAFAREPHIAAVFGSYDDEPAAPNFLSQYKNLLHHWVHQTSRPEASTFWAGCGAIRAAVFAEVGGFDESYRRPSVEDIEIGSRLRAAGQSIRLRRSLQAKHLKRWTARSLLVADVRDRALPWAALLVRDGLVSDLNLRWSSRLAGAAAQCCLATLLLGFRWPALWLLTAGFVAALLVLDAPLYTFLRRKRGRVFAAGCVLWHSLYYLYASTAFAWVLLRRPWTRGAAVKGAPRRLGGLAPADGHRSACEGSGQS